MAAKKIAVFGAGGFIGSHLARRLTEEGNLVHGFDLKKPEFEKSIWHHMQTDLRAGNISSAFHEEFDEVYQLAADMGGAGYVFTGENDFNILLNSSQINLNTLGAAARGMYGRVFFSSSACVYKENPDDPRTPESLAYPANPDSEYGWEKLFSERIYQALRRNRGVGTRIGRYHNIFGPYGTFTGGREKAPAALCRKVAQAKDGENIEVWGNGAQKRSFLFIDDCVEGTIRLMRSAIPEPLNIGSEETVTLRDLAEIIIFISGKQVGINYVEGPRGVQGRTSDNRLIREKLNWEPLRSLGEGLRKTYAWINHQVNGENTCP